MNNMIFNIKYVHMMFYIEKQVYFSSQQNLRFLKIYPVRLFESYHSRK